MYAPGAGPLHRIRVAVHVITSGSGTSATGYISPTCIQQGINLLNDDFRANSGTKAGNAGSIDTRIEFVLATTNTHGASTSGYQYINNHGWLNAHSSDTQLRNMWSQIYSNFPRTQYMNIVTKVAVRENGQGLLGYATLAQTPGTLTDGVTIAYAAWGPPGCASSSVNNGGATASHEVGHYLGLKHTFNDAAPGGTHQNCGIATFPGCTQSGDYICDTETEADAIYDCTNRNSCGTRSSREPWITAMTSA